MVVLFPIVFAGRCLYCFIADGQRALWFAFVLLDRLSDFAVADQMVECPNGICIPPARCRRKGLAGPAAAFPAGRAVCVLLYRRAAPDCCRFAVRHHFVRKMGIRESGWKTFCL